LYRKKQITNKKHIYRVMKTLLSIFASLLISFTTFANSDANDKTAKKTAEEATSATVSLEITGSVIDKANNETLAGVVVYVDGEKVYTDLDGVFKLSRLTPGKHEVKAELISYEPSIMEIDVRNNSNITIEMSQQ
jgi:hypothetical protein